MDSIEIRAVRCGAAGRPEDLTTECANQAQAILEAAVARRFTPGLSAAVVKNDRIVYQGGAGFADAPQKLAASHRTWYHWWSMTKMATAVAVLQLRDRGLLELDAPARRYLPFFELDGDNGTGVTIRRLLQHTSGLPDSIPAMIGWVHFEDEVYDQTLQLRKYMPAYNRLKFQPGSQAAYSNFGYMVLGAVIEQVSGISYEDYICRHLLAPLSMNETRFLYPAERTKSVAAGTHPVLSAYTPLLPFLLDMKALVRERVGGRLWFNRVYLDVTPPSGLIGSVSDAALLANALLSQTGLISMAGHALLAPTDETPAGRPLGWAEYRLGERPWLQHRGGGPGFAALMRLYPQEALAVILMANSTHLPAEKLAEKIAKLDWKE